MLDSGVTVVLVTHMYELAKHLVTDDKHPSLSLKAELQDGHPSHRVVPGPPRRSSSVSKAYQQVFGQVLPPSNDSTEEDPS